MAWYLTGVTFLAMVLIGFRPVFVGTPWQAISHRGLRGLPGRG